LVSKIILSLFSLILLFQAHQVYADEELPVITIDFVSGDIIDLDDGPQMIRLDVQIHNYNPQDGYTWMEVTRVSDGEIIKNTEIFPMVVGGSGDGLFGVQAAYVIEPGQNEETLIGDYTLRIYSDYGSSASVSTFSIVKSSMPDTVTQTAVEESAIPTNSTTTEELVASDESLTLDEYYDDLEDQLENFCSMTNEEQIDFFSENPDIID